MEADYKLYYEELCLKYDFLRTNLNKLYKDKETNKTPIHDIMETEEIPYHQRVLCLEQLICRIHERINAFESPDKLMEQFDDCLKQVDEIKNDDDEVLLTF